MACIIDFMNAPALPLQEKTILITGATSGIGYAAAQALSAMGAAIIGVGRDPARCQQAAESLRAARSDAQVIYLTADLSAQRQVRSLAESALEQINTQYGGKLDGLINNAGAVASWYTATEDGYELQFALNHLAPFLLTHLLMPALQAAPAARILTVSSRSHRNMVMVWADVMLRRWYNPLLAYKQSKLANVLFTLELNRRLPAASPIRAYAIDPGLVNTNIGLKGTGGIVRWVWEMRSKGGQTPEQGASTAVFVASDPTVEGSREPYWKNSQPLPPSRYAQRPEPAARLWELSERLCGIQFRMD